MLQMLKKIICFFLLLLSVCKLSAQVNLQTGSAVFSLPMFNWQDSKSRLYGNVAISYNSGNGLKVNDIASCIGQGWNLLAGGVITRLQIGEPDDQQPYGSGEDINQYPPGYLFATVPAQNGCPNALTKYPIYNPMNHLYAQHNITAEDKQVDRFAFQFNGKAGMFVIDHSAKNGNDVCAIVGDTKMKVTFTRDYNLANTEGARTVITSFTIQDVDGLIYKFTQHAATKVLKTDYCDASLTQALTQPEFEGGKVYYQSSFDNTTVNPYIIDGWYLTEIRDPFTSRSITLTYNKWTLDNIGGADISYNKDKDYSIVTYKRSISSMPALASINFPDGHLVNFSYGNERVDLKGDRVLSSVIIKYKGRSLSQYQLSSTYFISNRYGSPVSGYQKSVARLCLKSVSKIGVDAKEDTPPYIFDYYTGSGNGDDYVPAPFNYAKDIWGYYNGSNSIAYNYNAVPLTTNISQLDNNQLKGLCFLRYDNNDIVLNPKGGYAKNGLLKQIIYPTGGTLSYQYAQNAGAINGPEEQVGGVHVTATSSTDGGYSNDCDHPIVTNYSYVSATGVSSLWGLEKPVNSMQMSSHWEPEKLGWHWGLSCFTGCCYWEYKNPGILSQSGSISLTNLQQFMNTMAPVLGILSAISTVMDIVNVCLDATPLAIVAIALDVIAGVVQYILTCRKDARDETSTIYYNADLNSVSPLPAQFKRVEVTESPGSSGKTVSEFTSNDDYDIWYTTNPLFSPKQRFAPWAYGLPKKMTVYDAAGKKVKESENVYDFNLNKTKRFIDYDSKCYPCWGSEDDPVVSKLANCKCQVKQSTSQRNTDWESPDRYNNDSYQTSSDDKMGVDIYGMFTGRVELSTSYERAYKSGDDRYYTQTQTDYEYNDGGESTGKWEGNYDIKALTVSKSNGEVDHKQIFYNSDYNSGILSTLSANNRFSVPVEITEQTQKSWNAWKSIKNNVTEYLQSSTGEIKPYRTLEQRFADPSLDIVRYYGPGTDISKYSITQINTYDIAGNLTGIKDEGNRTVANIYGYDDKYVTASVINADPVADKPAYSSFETSDNFGGWTLNGNASYDNTKAVTGSSSFVLSGNSFTASINAAKSYIVSCWATSSISVSSGSVAKTGPVVNGFTYYEYTMPQGNASITVSGSATIDELRIYPQNARMRTVTYDPLIGKTSSCDENNRITYFEYDNLGRLQFEKDENKDVVKMHEYNNVSAAKQKGCPNVFYNNLITESFTKSNCGAGYAGKDISYSIPANKYSSSLSQWDADMKAQQELMASGQANADNTSTTNGCQFIYYNDALSQSFTTDDGLCAAGYAGGAVSYAVPANKYSSLVSKADANRMAQTEINANGQMYANDPAHRACTVNTTAEWRWYEGDSAYCLTVNGQLPAHRFGYALDVNPNSSTYNQRQWKDMGVQNECPADTYFNAEQSGSFTSQCLSTRPTRPVIYAIPPGKYSSTISQAAADQLAIDDINANGQNYANGACPPTKTGPITFYGKDGSSGSNLGFVFNMTQNGNFMANGYVTNQGNNKYTQNVTMPQATNCTIVITTTSSVWKNIKAEIYCNGYQSVTTSDGTITFTNVTIGSAGFFINVTQLP
jgi:hypothetical protein